MHPAPIDRHIFTTPDRCPYDLQPSYWERIDCPVGHIAVIEKSGKAQASHRAWAPEPGMGFLD
jgi:hypothetical protein